MSSSKWYNHSLALLILVFLHILNITKSQPSQHHCHPNDQQVLLNIKLYLGNPSSLSSWNPNNKCGGPYNHNRWRAVGTNAMGRVESLWFNHIDDIYTIPPFLDQLPALTTLSFYFMNNFTGPIPPYIVNLNNLTSFMISITNLSGPIPSFLGRLTKLETLELNLNKLSGPIPDSIGQLTSLTELNLSNNSLSGRIPVSLSKLTKLMFLLLDTNKLSGPIPADLGRKLVKLVTLDLHSNYLSGSIPESLARSTSIPYILLSGNRLTGPIPKSLAKAGILNLSLARNKLTGDASFLLDKNMNNSYSIDISNNFLKFDLTNVKLSSGLVNLNISHNMIYGKLPKQFYRLLKRDGIIDVSFNDLCGPIPNGRSLKWVDPSTFAHNKCLCGEPLPPCK